LAAIVLARFKLRDYDFWRPRFEANAEVRRAAGCLGTHIFYNTEDPTDVTVNFQWEDEAGARAYLGGAQARALRDEGGVIDFDFWFVQDAGRTLN
jgi:quinol monooxygenase YgiN